MANVSNPEQDANRFLGGLSPQVKDHLLGKLIKERVEQNDYFIPQEAWDSIQKAFRLPYAEVLVVRKNLSGLLEGALTFREDQDWHGWHIPGGRVGNPTLSFEEACNLVAKRELGISVRLLDPNPVFTYLWQDHPYGYPISLLGVAVTNQRIPRGVARFFSEPPENMVAHHANFFQKGLDFVAQNPLLLDS